MATLTAELCAKLSAEVLEELHRMRVRTVSEFLSRDLAALSQRTAIPREKLSVIRNALLSQCAPHPITADTLWREMEERTAVLPTGCGSLDALLGGGFLTGEVTEIAGRTASGKTQLCITLVANVVMATAAVACSPTVAVVDSGGGFSAVRLEEVMVGRGASEEAVHQLLERVRVYQVYEGFDLLGVLGSLCAKTGSQADSFHSSLRLVVVDSITPLLSPLLGGRQFKGHALICHVASSLKQLALERAVCVVYAHNMVADFQSSSGVKPALGRTWSSVAHCRLILSRSHSLSSRQTSALLDKSSNQAIGSSCSFSITNRGLQNN